MNSDELKDKAKDLAGRAKEAAERAKGTIQEKLGRAKQDVAEERAKHERRASDDVDPAERK